MGLYGLYFLGPIAAIFGMLGLILVSIHGAVGYEIATTFNLIVSNSVIGENESRVIDLVNGAFWAIVYGGIFLVYRKFKLRREK